MNKQGMSSAGVRRWKAFEREVVRILRKLAPRARRNLQYQRDHGAPDVEAGVLWTECKSGKKHGAVETIYRATAQKARGHKRAVPAVVSKAQDGRGTKLVTLSLKDLIRIAGASKAEQRELWRRDAARRAA